MSKTKEQIKKYNKEYFSRPEVKARAKVRNFQRKDKRRAYKKTEKGKEAEKRFRKKYILRSAGRIFERNLFLRYKLTIEAYENMLSVQKGRCAICLIEHGRKLHIDHDHSSGRVRGLLCGSCNRGLGLLRDNVDFLGKAIIYLSK